MRSGLFEELRAHVADHGMITVGIVGFGHMGSSLFAQLHRMRGLRPAVVSTSRPAEVRSYVQAHCGIEDHLILETDDPAVAGARIAEGGTVVTADPLLLPGVANVDVVVDATGNPELGAKLSWLSLEHGKHVATFNIEADSVIGSILSAKAQDQGVVYTGLAGDEPAAIMELVDFASLLEFDVVAVGKGKNNALRPECTPDMFAGGVPHMAPSAKSMCSFVDGTNTMIEMAAVANAIGFGPDVPGMHGPSCTPADLSRTFVPRSAGGILSRDRVVDFATGSIAPGVFVIVRSSDPIVNGIFSYVMGEGTYRALYRPYHLISLEAPISIAEAAVRGRGTIASKSTQRTAEVVAVAKRDLPSGERIDGIGGFAVRGSIDDFDRAVADDLVPVGLLENAVVSRAVRKGEPVTAGDVELAVPSAAVALWRRQRSWLDAGGALGDVTQDVLRAPLEASGDGLSHAGPEVRMPV